MPNSAMLRFIQILPNASVSGDFILKDLPGSGKRIDVLCRVLAASFEWGPYDLERSQIEVIAIIGNSVILRFGYPKENIPSGEKAWAQVIKESLKGNPPDFVLVSEGNLESVIMEINSPPKSNLWVLHEEGAQFDMSKSQNSMTENSFMLGNHRGFNSHAEELISKHALQKVSLGNTSYLSSHCVARIISEFERKDK
jgi:tRNA (pseudouridine54-N1)-methyltransferase